MSDSTPLLSQSDSNADETTEKPQPPSLNDTIERYIGDFSWAQLIQAILVSLSWIFDAQQTFISVFTDAQPTWHCNNLGGDSSCKSVSNICQISKNSWSYDMPTHTSIISEWGLDCSTSFVKGLPASSFFMGCLFGGLILATLADSSLGRKNMLVFSCLVMSVSSLLTVFSNNVWVYSLLRFGTGFGRATIQTSAIVLSSEVVGKKWRAQVGTIGFFSFTIGFLSLPTMAYINEGNSWRNLYLWTSVPTIFYCIVVRLFVRESPRWLFIQGRKEEAISIIKSIAPTSYQDKPKIDIVEDYLYNDDHEVDQIDQISRLPSMMSFSNVTFEQEASNVDIYSAIKILVCKRWALRRLVALMSSGFGIGMVYYGMPLGLGNLSFNLYWSVVFNALAEVPAALFTLIFIGKLNRKGTLIVLTALSGLSSIMCVVVGKVWPGLQIGLELFSFCSATTAFNFLIMYTIELFPTCVRNSALSIERQALVLGGVFSPILVAAGRENGYLSFGVFGLVIGISGLYVIGLPETKNKTLSDTMDEEEHRHIAGCDSKEFVN